MAKEKTLKEAELIYPYCGGCGHIFYSMPKETPEEAAAKASSRTCGYCMEGGPKDDDENNPYPGAGTNPSGELY